MKCDSSDKMIKDMSKNIITGEGGKSIAKAISVNTTLNELNISKNVITDEGANNFAEAIRVNRSLKVLIYLKLQSIKME